MKRILLLLCVVTVLGLLTATVLAQPPGGPVPGMPMLQPAVGGFYPGPVYDRYYLPYYRFRLYLNPQAGHPPPAYGPYAPPAIAPPYALYGPAGF